MSRRIVTGVLVFLLSFGFMALYSPTAKAIKDFSVEVTPRRAGSVARYALTMSFEKTKRIRDWLHLSFPKGTKLFPPWPEEEYQRKLRLKEISESILYGPPCSACTGLPIIVFETDGSVTLKFHVTPEVDPTKEGYKTITIVILETAGFTNPPQSGNYIFKFCNQQEPTFVESSPVTIEESKISKPIVTVQNPIINQISGYDIEFRTGSAGKLGFRTNVIYLAFPPGTEIPTPPKDILYQLVTINGCPMLLSPAVDFMMLTFFLPFTINDASDIKIHIDPKWGIKNPRNPGNYILHAYTSTEFSDVISEPFEIKKGPDSVFLDVIPPKTDKPAEFDLTLVAEEDYEADHDSLLVIFPYNINLPTIIDPQFVTIQGRKAEYLTILDNMIELKLLEPIKKGVGFEVTFSKEAGIRTPPTPCQIGLIVSFKNSKNGLLSNFVDIETQTLAYHQIQVNPPNASEKASYQFQLIFGDNQTPRIGEEIQVQFSFLDQPIHFAIKENLPQEYILTLLDIQNPTTGYYSVFISTTREKKKIRVPIWIIPARPVTKINITDGKLGKNSWYVEVPLIGFESSDPDSMISIYFDDPKNGIVYYKGHPLPPDPGQYITKLYYFSTNAYGQEIPKSVEIKVDYVNPYINLIIPENNKIEINKNEFTIEGKVSPIKTIVYGADKIEPDRNLTIQDKSVEVRDDGSFFYDATLLEGMNEITVHLEDDAGRYIEKKYSVLLDTIPPKLEINYPIQNTTILEKKMILKGKTEPSALVVINGEIVYVDEGGSFQQEVSLHRPGLEQVEIIATDNLSNSTTKIVQFFFGYTIQLKIGSVTARNNTIDKQMPIAPLIQKGRTLVPFRFIGEELKATITFQPDPKTKLVKTVSYELDGTKILLTIGSTQAYVNGVEVKLEVPAQIMKGSTVVPLRFVTEGLGCLVEWEPKNQMINITYPGK